MVPTRNNYTFDYYVCGVGCGEGYAGLLFRPANLTSYIELVYFSYKNLYEGQHLNRLNNILVNDSISFVWISIDDHIYIYKFLHTKPTKIKAGFYIHIYKNVNTIYNEFC